MTNIYGEAKKIKKELKEELAKDNPSYTDIGTNLLGLIFIFLMVYVPTGIVLSIMGILIAPFFLLSYILGFVAHQISKFKRGTQ